MSKRKALTELGQPSNGGRSNSASLLQDIEISVGTASLKDMPAEKIFKSLHSGLKDQGHQAGEDVMIRASVRGALKAGVSPTQIVQAVRKGMSLPGDEAKKDKDDPLTTYAIREAFHEGATLEQIRKSVSLGFQRKAAEIVSKESIQESDAHPFVLASVSSAEGISNERILESQRLGMQALEQRYKENAGDHKAVAGWGNRVPPPKTEAVKGIGFGDGNGISPSRGK